MEAVYVFIICSIFAIGAQCKVTLLPDIPFQSVKISEEAYFECCFITEDKLVKLTWVKSLESNKRVPLHLGKPVSVSVVGKYCGKYTFTPVHMNDSGLYTCFLNGSVNIFTHGTYLQVFKPLEKTINLSEKTKNRILIAEGILLFLCVLMPSSTLLFKSKKLHQLQKKKAKREEENIYQGLNLDDCCSAYDQIERSKAGGPYEDVAIIEEEEEGFDLEKP